MSSSDSDDEVAVRYGTPLEPYEEDEVPAKRRFQQNAEQHAVDAHGRRRFHGAFTGGFSAGHGNSVSTPEGWTPQAFKSTRADRSSFKNQAPEDFMDEEDRDEFGIAPRLIQTQDDFGGQKRQHPSKRFHDGPIPGEPVLEQFVRAVPETAAVRLLRAMGWRPGSGVGERVARERKAKTYGCYVPPEFRQNAEEGYDSDGSEVDYDALFAPQDYEPYLLSRKDDQFGLGYSGLSRRSVLGGLSGEYGASDAGVSHLKMRDKGKKVSIRGQAFGVGALEEEDEDVYAHQDMSHYDFAIGGTSDANANQHRDKKDKPKSEGLEGFVRSVRVSGAPRGYPAPALPRDYTPAPAGFARTRFAPVPDSRPTHTDRGLGRHDLSAEARGAMLGEPPVPPIIPNPTAMEEAGDNPNKPTANVTSVPAKPTQRPGLQEMLYSKLLGRNVAFTPSDEEWGKRSDEEPATVAASRDVDESGSEERVFRPFASDPAKQERYERFLKSGGTEEDGAVGEQDGRGRLAEWEVERERKEFEQAAKLYRPLTGVLKDRFTSGGAGDGDDTAATKPAKLFGSADQLEAAKRGMYGALTRTVAQWRPDSLVCKRFNIPDPYSTRPDTKKTDNPKTSYSIFEYLEGSIHSKESFTKEQAQFSGSRSILTTTNPGTSMSIKKPTLPVIQKPNEIKTVVEIPFKLQGNKRITVAELFLMEAEKERLNKSQNGNAGEVMQTIDKFDKMELYNAIFMSDSEDEGVDDDNETKKVNKSDADFLETPENTERNTSPPRGIFANLDFDQLNSWSSKNKTVEKGNHDKTTKKEDINEESDEIEEVFVTSKTGGVAIQSKDKPGEKIRMANDNKADNKEMEPTDDEDELLVSATGGIAKKSQKVTSKKDKTGPMDIDEVLESPKITENDLYGPKIPENLKKKIETNASELEKAKMFGNTMVSKTAYKELDIEDVLLNTNELRAVLPRPLFRDKNMRQEKEKKVIEVESSSDSDSWVDINTAKSKKVKKKSATGGVVTTSQNVTLKKDNTGPMDIDELFQCPNITENDLYGPKIPENLKKKIETNATELEKAKMFGNTMVSKTAYKELDIEDVLLNRNESRSELPRPLFRDKNSRQKKEKKVIEVESSSDSDSWVDINAAKKQQESKEEHSKKVKKKKKNKKHKHKSKKNKKSKSK